MNTDPIADLLTRMRNAQKAKHDKTVAPHSKLKIAVLEVLKKNNYVQDFKTVREGSREIIQILFPANASYDLKRISKPGQRIYIKSGDIKQVLDGYGISILSTSKGVMTGKEAKKAGLGGEVICEIW